MAVSWLRVMLFAWMPAAIVVAAACNTDTAPSDEPTSSIDAGPKKIPPASDASGDGGDVDASVDAGNDAAKPWPTCNAKPASAAKKTIPEIWQANPTKETEVWIEGAYVTAISNGGCAAGTACQIFVQADPSYATLADAAHHSIKLFASGPVAGTFATVDVGDRVDILGWAWRYNLGGQNELLVQINALLPGCAKTKSTGNVLTPLEGLVLSDFTVERYENTHGPLFVKVASVSGKAGASPKETFGLWQTNDAGFFDAGPDAGATIVSLSPAFMSGGAFTGLVPGATTGFVSITAVFGLFVPNGGPKYLELYPRSDADLVKQ